MPNMWVNILYELSTTSLIATSVPSPIAEVLCELSAIAISVGVCFQIIYALKATKIVHFNLENTNLYLATGVLLLGFSALISNHIVFCMGGLPSLSRGLLIALPLIVIIELLTGKLRISNS